MADRQMDGQTRIATSVSPDKNAKNNNTQQQTSFMALLQVKTGESQVNPGKSR